MSTSTDIAHGRGDPTVALVRSPGISTALATGKCAVPPIGLAYLAGALRANGIDTCVIDAAGEDLDRLERVDFADLLIVGLPKEEIVERIPANADIIGISCMFSSSWPYDHRLIELIRSRFPDAAIVAGGEHVTACPEYVLDTCRAVDFCALGEGEDTIVELVQTLRGAGGIETIAGIAYRREGKATRTERRGRIRRIDDIAKPDWDGIPLENYMERGVGHGVTSNRSMPIMASRGCPFQCTFCSNPNMWTTRWSARTPVLVVDEMQEAIEQYGAENFDFYDLTAIVRKDWIVEFCQEILRRKLEITFQFPSGTRSEALDDEVLGYLKRAGCHAITYAPESGSPQTLKRIKKRVKLANMEKSMRAAAKLDMKVMVNIVVFPEDTWGSLRETFGFMLRFAVHGIHDCTMVPYSAYPGTELYDELRERGSLPPLSEAYFVSLNYSDFSAKNTYNPNFSPRQFQLIRLSFLGLFYLTQFVCRPVRMFRAIRNISSNTTATRTEDTLRRMILRGWKLSRAGPPPADS